MYCGIADQDRAGPAGAALTEHPAWTEAAFLPICSALLDARPRARPDGPDGGAALPSQRGVQVLYVSPLKALINDQ